MMGSPNRRSVKTRFLGTFASFTPNQIFPLVAGRLSGQLVERDHLLAWWPQARAPPPGGLSDLDRLQPNRRFRLYGHAIRQLPGVQLCPPQETIAVELIRQDCSARKPLLLR